MTRPARLNAVAEARRLRIPTVAIVDTNADPTLITHPIAGNDDAIRAIRVVLAKLVDAVIAGGGEGSQVRPRRDGGGFRLSNSVLRHKQSSAKF